MGGGGQCIFPVWIFLYDFMWLAWPPPKTPRDIPYSLIHTETWIFRNSSKSLIHVWCVTLSFNFIWTKMREYSQNAKGIIWKKSPYYHFVRNAENMKILDVLTRSVTLLGSSVRTGRSSSHLSKITLSTRSIPLYLFTLTGTDNVKSLSQTWNPDRRCWLS